MSSYGAKGTRTPNNRLQRTVRYALIMEEASEAERNKASWPYDGMAGFSEDPKSTSSGRLNCWSRQQTLSAATRRFVEAATYDGNFWGSGLQPQVGTVRCAKWDYCEIRHR
jgi:hypothetical protein